jgi:hypothetical protein
MKYLMPILFLMAAVFAVFAMYKHYPLALESGKVIANFLHLTSAR